SAPAARRGAAHSRTQQLAGLIHDSRRAAQLMVTPASTFNCSPVTYLDSSDSKNSTALLTSEGSTAGVGIALTKMGDRSARSSPRMAPNDGGIMPVGQPVGSTQLTRTFWAANSLANANVRPTTPYFAAL